LGEGCPLSEKVFLLLMGCSKNYIMYWGLRLEVYHDIHLKCYQRLKNQEYFFVKHAQNFAF
jgi:hypothetical protein